jgi:ATP-dependent DNA helicase RecG
LNWFGFKGAKWMAEKLKSNTEYIVYGKATSFMGRFNMAHPEINIVTPELLASQSSFQSVYNSTEKLKFRNLDSDGIRKCLRLLTIQLNEQNIQESLTKTVIQDFNLLSKLRSLKANSFS